MNILMIFLIWIYIIILIGTLLRVFDTNFKDRMFYLVSSVVYTCIIVGLCFVRLYLTV